MTMFRQSPPEYRALVVENEREFRADLIYTIESMDIGISVIAEASDYEDAMEILDNHAVDLLITDINLTDQPRFEVGVRDGTALALYARQSYDIPSIFLTAFADYDPDVVARAAVSDPIGFIQKQGTEVGEQTQQLIRIALRRLELIRREQESTQQLRSIVDQIAQTLIYIDQDGRILDFNEGAIDLLGQPGDALLDQHWEDVLRDETPSRDGSSPLARIIGQPLSAQLPTAALQTPDGRSIFCSVRVAPAVHLRQPCTLMMIQRLDPQAEHLALTMLTPGTSLLMIGFGGARIVREVDPTLLRIMQLDLRASLIAAVRRGDFVSQPYSGMLAVLMPHTDEGSAYAVAQTLLARIQSALGAKYPAITLRGGLAHRGENRSVGSTLAAAIDALDRAEHSNEHVLLTAAYARKVRDQQGAEQASSPANVEAVSSPTFRPPTFKPPPSRINLGLKLAASVLDIPLDMIGDLAQFHAALDGCLKPIPGVLGYSVCFFDAQGDSEWSEYRQLAPGAAHALEENPALQAALDAREGAITIGGNTGGGKTGHLSPLSFEDIGDFGVIGMALTDGQLLCGLLSVITELQQGKALRASNAIEKQLAGIIGEHIGRVLKRALRPAPAAPLSAAHNGTLNYNPYALRGKDPICAEAQLLIELDTPIAVIGEPGMQRASFVAWAAQVSNCAAVTHTTVIDGAHWSSDRQESALVKQLYTLERHTVIFRDPHRMHPQLQAALGTAIRSRQVPSDTGRATALPALRFAMTLPQVPGKMLKTGQLESALASALAAGVIELTPLRDLGEHALLIWARNILQAEARAAGRDNLSFEPAAERALAAHSWPGNLQELQDRIRDAVGRSPRQVLSELDLGLFRLEGVARAGSPSGESREGVRDPAGDSPRAGDSLEPLRATLKDTLNLALMLADPPPIGRWLVDEVLDGALQRFRGDRQPMQRAAELLHVPESALRALIAQAGKSANERQSTAYWQSTRLAIHSWLDRTTALEQDVRSELAPLVFAPLLARKPAPGDAEIERIAGSSLADYRAKLRETPV